VPAHKAVNGHEDPAAPHCAEGMQKSTPKATLHAAPRSTGRACGLRLEVCAHCRCSVVLHQGWHQVNFRLRCAAGVQLPRHACVKGPDLSEILSPQRRRAEQRVGDSDGNMLAAAERHCSYLSCALWSAPVLQRLSKAAGRCGRGAAALKNAQAIMLRGPS